MIKLIKKLFARTENVIDSGSVGIESALVQATGFIADAAEIVRIQSAAAVVDARKESDVDLNQFDLDRITAMHQRRMAILDLEEKLTKEHEPKA